MKAKARKDRAIGKQHDTPFCDLFRGTQRETSEIGAQGQSQASKEVPLRIVSGVRNDIRAGDDRLPADKRAAQRTGGQELQLTDPLHDDMPGEPVWFIFIKPSSRQLINRIISVSRSPRFDQFIEIS